MTRRGRPHPRVVVLHAAVDVVRVAHVDADGVELADRQVVDADVGLAAVPRFVETAVAGEIEVLGVVRIDPEGVEIAVYADVVGGARGERRERPAAVLATIKAGCEHVDSLVVGRVQIDVTVVHRTRVERIHLRPALAAVHGPVDPPLRGMLDDRHQHLRVGTRHGETDAALVALG